MTYRTQQILALSGLTLVASLASTAALYSLAERHFYAEYRAKLLSIAATAAALTDDRQLTSIHQREDEATPAYAELHRALKAVRDANRRKDTEVQRVFAVVQRGGLLHIAADAEEDPALMGRAGEVYRTQGAPLQWETAAVEQEFSND